MDGGGQDKKKKKKAKVTSSSRPTQHRMSVKIHDDVSLVRSPIRSSVREQVASRDRSLTPMETKLSMGEEHDHIFQTPSHEEAAPVLSLTATRVASTKMEALLKVLDTIPSISECLKSINLAARIQFYLECKLSYYYVY